MSNFSKLLVVTFLYINLIGSAINWIQTYCRKGLQLENNYYDLAQIDMEVKEI